VNSEDLARRYTAELIDAAPGDPADTAHIALTPRPGSDADPLELWIDENTHLPLRGLTSTADGDLTEVRLLKPVAATDLPGDTFSTDLPNGTEWHVQDVPFGAD
jgi:outer membrane lipoprotein-sorting protein